MSTEHLDALVANIDGYQNDLREKQAASEAAYIKLFKDALKGDPLDFEQAESICIAAGKTLDDLRNGIRIIGEYLRAVTAHESWSDDFRKEKQAVMAERQSIATAVAEFNAMIYPRQAKLDADENVAQSTGRHVRELEQEIRQLKNQVDAIVGHVEPPPPMQQFEVSYEGELQVCFTTSAENAWRMYCDRYAVAHNGRAPVNPRKGIINGVYRDGSPVEVPAEAEAAPTEAAEALVE